MGRRGPARVPTEIHQARGSRKGKSRGDTEPARVDAVPTAPSFLKGEAKRCWNRRVETLTTQKMLSETYREALSVYCQAWGEYYEITQEIKRRGGLVSHDKVIDDETGDETGEVIAYASKEVKDLLSLRKQAYETLLRVGPQFGWTPSTKSEVKINAPAPVGRPKKDKDGTPAKGPRRFNTAEDFGIFAG